MASRAPESRSCPFLGPWVVSRDVHIGRFCWHPDNLDCHGRIHLKSLGCGEWPICPLTRDQLRRVYR